jgi:hypothetical protein
MHDKELITDFDCFTHWRHYLEGAPLTVDVVTDHKNLKYFASTKVLTCWQVHWSEYLCHFNMVIWFRPGKLGGKPDALTRRWDIYPKEGDTAFSQINPQNFRPIFTSDQLSASLNATFLEDVCLQASLIMDVASLHRKIISHYPDDPAAVSGIASATSGASGSTRWTMNPTGLLLLSNRIYVPQVSGDTPDILRVRVLKNKHDHILSGHFGQNRTLTLVRCEYAWPEMRSFVCDYCPALTASATRPCGISLTAFSVHYRLLYILGIQYPSTS